MCLSRPGPQQFPDLPGHYRRDHHAGGQAQNDCHSACSNDPPHQDGRQHPEQRREDEQPTVCPDEGLGLGFHRQKATRHDLVLTAGRQHQPEQPYWDPRESQAEDQPQRSANFASGDTQPRVPRPDWNRCTVVALPRRRWRRGH